MLSYYPESAKFDNFSGLPHARLSRCQSVRGEGRDEPSIIFRSISFLFFRVPAKYLKLLDGIYMDNVVFQAPFRAFILRVSGGWQQDVVNVGIIFGCLPLTYITVPMTLNSQAAVLFAANIAYLAVPNLLPGSDTINAAAAASIVSIILSLASIVFGQLLGKKLAELNEEPTLVVVS